jgi:hypothetical protein
VAPLDEQTTLPLSFEHCGASSTALERCRAHAKRSTRAALQLLHK